MFSATEKGTNVADALHHVTVCLFGDAIDHGIALSPFTCVDADFYQFVHFQCLVDLGHDVIGQAVLANNDNDLAMVGELA